MPTANEEILDAQVGHAVDLTKYSNGVVRRILALLNRTDADLFSQLSAALERLPAASFTVERLEQLLASVRALNLQAYQEVERELTAVLREFAEYEAGFQLELFRSTIPAQVIAQVPVNAVSIVQVYSAALSRPFQGRLLSEWSKSIQADRMARIRDAVRIGYTENQTTAQIVQRIRGTRAKGYIDGIIEIDRRSAEAVVRTAISHTAAVARDAFIEENADLVKAVVWTATLDSKTSPICRVRDGLKYTADTHKAIGHKVPWLGGPGQAHWGCRSTACPVLKSFRELGIPVDDTDPGTRASMDGQVPASTSYAQWLQRQPAARQDEVLGQTRGRMLRSGAYELGAFSNNKGEWLSLEQLAARDLAKLQMAAGKRG